MQFEHAWCDECRGSFHVVLVISNPLYRPIRTIITRASCMCPISVPARARARENFPELRGDIFMRSISRTYVGKTYSRARAYNCSLREFKVWNSRERAYLLQFNILSCAFSSLLSSFLPSLLLSGVYHFQFRTFCIFGTVTDRKQLPNTPSCGHLVLYSREEAFGIYNFQRLFNDHRLMHGFPYELWSSFARLLRWLGTFHRISGAHLVFAVPSSL